MVYRYGWLAGAASIAFALWRLGRLLEPSQSGTRWQLVIIAALVVGLIVTLAAIRNGLRIGWVALINIVLFMVAAGRYAAPETGVWILPNAETLSAVLRELDRAQSLIRNGIEPVQPIAGLIIVLAAVFWALGALLSFGLEKQRPYIALIPPLVVGLQLLTIERRPASSAEIALFVLLVAATALAVGLDEHDRGAGRMAKPGHHPTPSRGAPLSGTALALVLVTVIAAVGISGALADRIPGDGVMTWRAPGALSGGLYGSVSYNPFVGIHDSLVTQTGRELFTAQIDGNVDPDDVYYRLITLDGYDDGRWFPSQGGLVAADDLQYESAGYEYAGETVPITAAITIHALGQEMLPVPYAVRGVSGEESDSFRIRTRDASILFAGDRTYTGMEYNIAADVPLFDSSAVATNATGGLSPLFLVASQREGTVTTPDPDAVHRTLPDAVDYLGLPDGIDPRIEAKARELTSRLETDFEKGLALEYWFRETGGFTYSLDVDVEAGHGPDVVARWLFDTESTDYRRGFCEDFATSMGVMARSLGIPTRVVLGFLPGETGSNGEVLVRDLSGHAWVELWIPSQGWMRFDPTPRGDNPGAAYQRLRADIGFDVAAYLDQVEEQPGGGSTQEFELPGTDSQPVPAPGGFPVPGAGGNTGGRLSIILLIALLFVAITAAVLTGIPAMKWVRSRARMSRLSNGDISAAWEEIVAQLADLDRPIDPAATPHEVASDVGAGMGPLAMAYTKSIYGPGEEVSSTELEAASRSMTTTAQHLTDGLSTGERVRAAYRLDSILGAKRLSRWLPWPRP